MFFIPIKFQYSGSIKLKNCNISLKAISLQYIRKTLMGINQIHEWPTPWSLQFGVLIQPDYVFSSGASISHDLCTFYYKQPDLHDINVQRVFVVGDAVNTMLLAMQIFVISAWWTGHHSMQSAIESGTASASDPISAPFLAVCGSQPAIDSAVSAANWQVSHLSCKVICECCQYIAGLSAVAPPTNFILIPTADGSATVADHGHSVRKELQGILVGETTFLRLVDDFMSGVKGSGCEHVGRNVLRMDDMVLKDRSDGLRPEGLVARSYGVVGRNFRTARLDWRRAGQQRGKHDACIHGVGQASVSAWRRAGDVMRRGVEAGSVVGAGGVQDRR